MRAFSFWVKRNQALASKLVSKSAFVFFSGAFLISLVVLLWLIHTYQHQSEQLGLMNILVLICLLLAAGLVYGYLGLVRLVHCLRHNQENYQFLYSRTPVMMHSFDSEGKIISVSNEWLYHMGYSREEVIGRKSVDFLTPSSRQYAEQTVIPQYLETGFCKDIPYQFIKKTGEVSEILLSATIERDPQGRMIRSLAVLNDVTQQKKAERSLRESEATKSSVLQSALDCIITMDQNGLIRDFNAAAEATFGYRSQDVIGKEMASYIIPERLREAHRKGLAHLLETQEGPILGKRVEMTALRADGTEFPVELSVIRVSHVHPPLFTGFIRDITETLRAKEDLSRYLSLLEATLESTADGILVVDLRGQIVQYNQKFLELWHLSKKEIEEKEDSEIIHSVLTQLKNPSVFLNKLEELYGDPRTGSFDVLEFKDGRFFERLSLPQKIDGKIVGRVWSFRDVTDRKVTQESLQHSLAALEKTHWQSQFLSEASRILASSLDYEKTLQSVTQLIVPKIAHWCLLGIFNESNQTIQTVSAAISPKNELLEKTMTSWSFHANAIGGIPEAIRTRQTQVYDHCDQLRTQNSTFDQGFQQLGTTHCMSVPMIIRDQAVGGLMMGISKEGGPFDRSVVELMEELARRCAVAIENSRLYHESLRSIQLREDFISIASHELRTPLTPLKIQIFTLKKHLKDVVSQIPHGRDLERILQSSDQQLNRITRLVEDLLDVTRISKGQFTLHRSEFDLGEMVQMLTERYQSDLNRAGCRCVIAVELGLRGNWDRARIEQVFVNLLMNAIKYGPSRPIEIRVFREDQSVRLSIRDYGIGIEKGDQVKIFNRFERAVPITAYGGLGLGLFITQQIVAAHGGKIWVESEVGQGSIFVIQLPLQVLPAKVANF